jgi:hypothetical protein
MPWSRPGKSLNGRGGTADAPKGGSEVAMHSHRWIGIAALALALGCNGNSNVGQVDVALGATSHAAAAKAGPSLSITGDVHLTVTVESVQVFIAPSDDDEGDDDDRGDDDHEHDGGVGSVVADAGVAVTTTGWVTVFTGPRTLDLFDVTATTAFLGSAAVPPGRITKVRLILDPSMTLTIGGQSITIDCPSCSQDGVAVVIRKRLTVVAGETLHLTLNIDQTASLRVSINGFHLEPVVDADD